MLDLDYGYVSILVLGLVVAALVSVGALVKFGLSALAKSPVVLFSIYFSVVHFFTPLLKYLEGYYRYQYTYRSSTFMWGATLAFSTYLLATVLMFIFFPKLDDSDSRDTQYLRLPQLRIVAIAMFLLGTLAAWFDYNTLLQGGGLGGFLADRHFAAEERGAGRVFVNLMIVGMCLYVAACASEERFKAGWVGVTVLMVGIGFAYFSIISSRNSFLLMILFGLCSYFFFSPRGKKGAGAKKIFLVSFSIVIAVNVLLYMTMQRYSASDSAYTQERLSNIWLYMFDGAFGNDESVLWMLEHNYDLLYGKTYLAAFLNFIPRSVWQEKPLGGGPELINMIYPGSYVVGAAGNNSLTTGFLTEAVMNFGVFGVLIVLPFWIFISRYAWCRALTSKTLTVKVVYALLLFSMLSAFVYSEFLGYLVRVGVYLVPLLVLRVIFPRVGRNAGG